MMVEPKRKITALDQYTDDKPSNIKGESKSVQDKSNYLDNDVEDSYGDSQHNNRALDFDA
jgi:hypothetical protein